MWATYFSQKENPGHYFPFNATEKYLPFDYCRLQTCCAVYAFQKHTTVKTRLCSFAEEMWVSYPVSCVQALLQDEVSGWMEHKRPQEYRDCNRCHIPGVLPVLVHHHVNVLIITLTIFGNFGRLDSGERLHTKTFYKIIICLWFWTHVHVWPLPCQKRALPKGKRQDRIWCHVNSPQSKWLQIFFSVKTENKPFA